MARKQHGVRKTLLIVGEGDSEEAFLKHLRDLYCSGGAGVMKNRTRLPQAALGQLVLGDASSFHIGVLSQVLSGLHERAVRHERQAQLAR